MVSGRSALQKNEGTNRVPPNILHAAEIGDVNEALAAIREDKNCITEVNDINQNALQVALFNFHEPVAFFLLNQTEISVKHRDALERDSLDIALFGASEKLTVQINERWYDEPDPPEMHTITLG